MFSSWRAVWLAVVRDEVGLSGSATSKQFATLEDGRRCAASSATDCETVRR